MRRFAAKDFRKRVARLAVSIELIQESSDVPAALVEIRPGDERLAIESQRLLGLAAVAGRGGAFGQIQRLYVGTLPILKGVVTEAAHHRGGDWHCEELCRDEPGSKRHEHAPRVQVRAHAAQDKSRTICQPV